MNSSPGCSSDMHGEHLRRVAGGHGERRRAAFERGDPLLEHRAGRIADAGVDVAEGLQAEQRGCMIDVVEHERRGLVDRRRPGAGRRIRRSAGMNRKRAEAGQAVTHSVVHGGSSGLGSSRWRMSDGRILSITKRSRRQARYLRPVEAQLLKTLAGEHRLLGAEDTRVHALPGDLAREATELDLRTAVHDDVEAARPRPAPQPLRCGPRAASRSPSAADRAQAPGR